MADSDDLLPCTVQNSDDLCPLISCLLIMQLVLQLQQVDPAPLGPTTVAVSTLRLSCTSVTSRVLIRLFNVSTNSRCSATSPCDRISMRRAIDVSRTCSPKFPARSSSNRRNSSWYVSRPEPPLNVAHPDTSNNDAAARFRVRRLRTMSASFTEY